MNVSSVAPSFRSARNRITGTALMRIVSAPGSLHHSVMPKLKSNQQLRVILARITNVMRIRLTTETALQRRTLLTMVGV